MVLRKSAFAGPVAPLYFGTGLIDLVESNTCLGVKIDSRLSWSVRIDYVKKYFTQKVGALNRIRILPKKSLEENDIVQNYYSKHHKWNFSMGKLSSLCA